VQDGRIVSGLEGEPVADHHALDGSVEEHGEERVLEATHHDRLVDELILRPAQAPHFLGERGPASRRRGRDDEQLEVGPACLTGVQARWQAEGPGALGRVVARLPVRGIGAIAVRHQRAVDALDEAGDVASVALRDLVLDRPQ
jgi:hypothetical protein